MEKSDIAMIIGGILVVAFVANMFWGTGSVTGNAVAQGNSNVGAQVVEIGLNRGGFTPQVVTVEANRPVILKNDGTLGGCGLYIVQPELGINTNFGQYDTYEFTPTKKGSFTYTCSMGMFKGTIEVV